MLAKQRRQHLSDLLPPKEAADDTDLHYYISASQNMVIPLYTMLNGTQGARDDPALKVSSMMIFADLVLTPFLSGLSS